MERVLPRSVMGGNTNVIGVGRQGMFFARLPTSSSSLKIYLE